MQNRTQAAERRLRRGARLEPGEGILTWGRAWVSPERRFHRLLALRTRDFLVLTDRRLMLFAPGFFTGRPRRRVVADRLDLLTVAVTGRRLVCSAPGHRTLRFEIGRGEAATALTDALTRLRSRTPDTG